MTTIPRSQTHSFSRRAQRGSSLESVEKNSRRNEVFSVQRGVGIGYAIRDFSHACLLRLTDYPDMPLRTNLRETVKAGRTALIVRCEFPVGESSVAAAYKRVHRPSWWKRLLSVLRTNPCQRNFMLGLELLRRGVPTARPLAAIIPHRWRFSADSYLATEWLEGVVHCYDWLIWLATLSADCQRVELRQSAFAIGELLGRMHGAGVAHRDLKPGNIVVRKAHRAVEAFVVDLDGVRLQRRISPTTRDRNLSRFVVTMTTHFPIVTRSTLRRGLKSYLRAATGAEEDWKTVWRGIAGQVERRLRKSGWKAVPGETGR